MTEPVKPQDLASGIVHAAPAFVIEAFNTLITKNHTGGRATVKQKDVIAEIRKVVNVSNEDIYKSGWLNVEAFYRNAGWEVTYNSPDYTESFDSHYVFSTKRA